MMLNDTTEAMLQGEARLVVAFEWQTLSLKSMFMPDLSLD